MTALTRMIVLQTKGTDAINIIYESLGIFILAISAYVMSMKDMISLKKISLRKEDDNNNG
jgi:protein PsiE